MTAIAAPGRETKSKYNQGDRYYDFIVASGQTIYPGAMVGLNAGGEAIEATTAAISIVGCYRGDITSGAAQAAVTGDVIRIYEGVHCWVGGGITIANRGDIAYVTDDQTVQLSGVGTTPAGVITDVDTDGVWVEQGLALHTCLKQALVDLT